jgi:hypothetical protein
MEKPEERIGKTAIEYGIVTNDSGSFVTRPSAD